MITLTTWRNTLLSQVKSYIDNNINLAKVNVIDPTKNRFSQPVSSKEILVKFETSKNDYYYRSLLCVKDEDLERHLKIELLVTTCILTFRKRGLWGQHASS